VTSLAKAGKEAACIIYGGRANIKAVFLAISGHVHEILEDCRAPCCFPVVYSTFLSEDIRR